MKNKWVIKDKENEKTKKHLDELEKYIELFCNKEENKFKLYKAIATPTKSFAIIMSIDVKDVYVELDLIINKIRLKEKPEFLSWEEYFGAQNNLSSN